MEEIKPVSIITVKSKISLFKGDEVAHSIELLQFEENGFEVVSGKDLYQIGEKVVFIQPDYCIPDNKLFEEYIRPNGDEKKGKLGSNNRIRAIKFNLHKGDGLPIYSQGIVLDYDDVKLFLYFDDYGKNYKGVIIEAETDLAKKLGITKWEQPDEKNSGGLNKGSSKPFPSGMYKTDESNINNLWNRMEYPIELIGTVKVDGSSFSMFYRNGESGICSRQLLKPLTYQKCIGYRKMNVVDWFKNLFGHRPNLEIYEWVESDSDFVVYGKPLLKKFVEYCKTTNRNLALRGELSGSTLKGSGNKNNPASKKEPNIKFYSLDMYEQGTVRFGEKEFVEVIDACDFERCPVVMFQTFNSREEIEEACNYYFKYNMVEGIVLRTPNHQWSGKFMNPSYDAKK